MMLILNIVLIMFLSDDVIGLPCLTNEAKDDFDKSRKDLTLVQSNIGTVVKTLESNHKQTITALELALKKSVSIMENNVKETTKVLKNNLGTFKTTLNSMDQKIKKLDTDFKVLGKDFRKTKWIKYEGHCYFYSPESADWYISERKCREIGGYLVKIDNDEEKKSIYSNAVKSYNYWIGLTDLTEGDFRWTYDQIKAVIKYWYPGHGSKGTKYQCGAIAYQNSKLKLFDQICSESYRYICESNFCF